MQELYAELAEYVGRNANLVREYCFAARWVLAMKWEDEKSDPIKYYKESKDYLYDSTMYQQVLKEQGFHEWIKGVIRDFKIDTVLDYGGGIGEYSIVALGAGAETVDYCDIPDSETEKYAKYRFTKHKAKVNIVNTDYEFPHYDLCIAMDVFEHIADNKLVIEDIAHHCNYLICNTPEEMPYDWRYPQHISYVFLEPHFDQVNWRLWKSKYATA